MDKISYWAAVMRGAAVCLLAAFGSQTLAIEPLSGWYSSTEDAPFAYRLNLDFNHSEDTIKGFVYSEQRKPSLHTFEGEYLEALGSSWLDTGSIGTLLAGAVEINFLDNGSLELTYDDAPSVVFTKEERPDAEQLTEGVWWLVAYEHFFSEFPHQRATAFEKVPPHQWPEGMPIENGTLYRSIEDAAFVYTGFRYFVWVDGTTGTIHAKAAPNDFAPWLLNDRPQWRLQFGHGRAIGHGEQSMTADGSTDWPQARDGWIQLTKLPEGWSCYPNDGVVWEQDQEPVCHSDRQPQPTRLP